MAGFEAGQLDPTQGFPTDLEDNGKSYVNVLLFLVFLILICFHSAIFPNCCIYCTGESVSLENEILCLKEIM